MQATGREARLVAAAASTVVAAGVLAAPAWAPRVCPGCGAGVLGLTTDAGTGAHLAGVVVEASPAVGDSDSAESNPGGRYLLRGLGPGRYALSARAEGYRPAGPVVVELVDGPPVHVDFALVAPPDPE